MRLPLIIFFILTTLFCILSQGCTPACSQQPAAVTAGPAMFEGSVDGHVLAAGSNASLPGAKVWLVNASNDNTTYGAATADSGGRFYFLDVSPLGSGAYRLKAQKGNDTGASLPFGVSRLENKTVDVYVHMRPASIALTAPRSYIVADGSDHIRITAIVTDSAGRTATADHPIIFTFLEDTPAAMQCPIIIAHSLTGDDGRATAEYGWVEAGRGASRTTIKAYVDGSPEVNASIDIDVRAVDSTPPATAFSSAGEPDNAGGYISDVTCTLAAQDPGGWGVNATYYRVGDRDWARYAGPFTISADGATTVYYYSTDLAGNAEAPKSRTILIHKS